VLIVLVPACSLIFRYVLPERIGIIILSAVVAHTAWHWMIERGAELAKFPMPKLDAALLASAMRALMAALILALGVLAVNGLVRRWTARDYSSAAKEHSHVPGE
jgi:dsRNA-specific ribonuclease